MALKDLLKDENPMRRNMPTIPALKVREAGNVSLEKKKWITLIEDYAHYSNPGFIHSFFGKMTIDEIGFLDYKHSDHHLRQFNG
jgi:hypothetical protein